MIKLIRFLLLSFVCVFAVQAFATDVRVDLTTPTNGEITYSASHESFPGAKAFDNGSYSETDFRWLATCNSPLNVWVQFKFKDGPQAVNILRICGLVSHSFDIRGAKAFTFEGSLDGSTWVELLNETHVPQWGDKEERDFPFINAVAYQYYRFTIIESHGSIDYVGVNELEFFYVASDHPPECETGDAVNVTAASATFEGMLTSAGTADTDVRLYWGATDGGMDSSAWDHVMSWNAPQAVGNFAYEDSRLVADSVYFFRYMASNSVGDTWADETHALVTDELSLEAVSNGSEETCAPAVFRVSRAPAVSQAAIDVYYEVSAGTAVAGVDYVVPSGKVTIPAGETTADFEVETLRNLALNEITTLTLSVLPINACVDATSTATAEFLNHNPYGSQNVWIATEAGLASNPANWSRGVPQAGDKILLNESSSANMTWDVSAESTLSATVASWTQTADYTGTVTFPINYDSVENATFTGFTVTGDVELSGGKWTHPVTTVNKPTYRLAVMVGGDFIVNASAAVDVSLRGYEKTKFHPGSATGVHGGGCGNLSKAYDSPYEPMYSGSGGNTHAGGGAIWIDCTEDMHIDGKILANSVQDSGEWNSVSSGAGGSIYLKAKSIEGEGVMSASASPVSRNAAAGGGRISIVLTESNTLEFPTSKINANGCTGKYSGGAGTIVVKAANQTYGTLFVKNVGRKSTYANIFPKPSTTTPIVGEWTFDAIKFGTFGILSIPASSKLVLPSGFGAVSGSNYTSGMLYLGGSIDPQGDAPYIFQSNWVFHAASPYVVTGDVSVVNGGAIGQLVLHNRSLSDTRPCQFSVVGDMTVDSTSWLYSRQAGLQFETSPAGELTTHGGQKASLEGNFTYGSALNPLLPGTEGTLSDSKFLYPGGGVIVLNVSGTLEMNGKAESSGAYNENCDIAGKRNNQEWQKRPGSGGSINITAGQLTGFGSIRAPGQSGNYNKEKYYEGAKYHPAGSTGGGRVSVRLTDADATFSEHWIKNITAKGASSSLDQTYTTNHFSSAGTVYLQTAQDGGEGFGQLIIRDYNNPVASNVVTYLPASQHADAVEDFKNVNLSVLDYAHVKIDAPLWMESLKLEEGSTLDLNGQSMTVRTLNAGGVSYAAGVYTDDSPLFDTGYVKDTQGSGEIVVLGSTTIILIR